MARPAQSPQPALRLHILPSPASLRAPVLAPFWGPLPDLRGQRAFEWPRCVGWRSVARSSEAHVQTEHTSTMIDQQKQDPIFVGKIYRASGQFRSSGLRWVKVGNQSGRIGQEFDDLWGREIFHTELHAALGRKAQQGHGTLNDYIEFTKNQWDSFGIEGLHMDDYIQVGNDYYEPFATWRQIMYMNFKSDGKPSFDGTPAEYRLRSSEYRRRLEEIGKNDPSVEDALATRYHSGGLSDQTAAEIYAFKRGKGIKEPGAETVLRTAKEPAMRHRTLHEKTVDSLSGNATQQPVSKQYDSLAEYLSTMTWEKVWQIICHVGGGRSVIDRLRGPWNLIFVWVGYVVVGLFFLTIVALPR